MAKPIGTLGTIDTLTVGGRVFTDLTNLLVLMGYTDSNTKASLRAAIGSSGWAVTGGKTLTIYAIRTRVNVALSATGNIFNTILLSTSVDLGMDGAGVLTGAAYMAGSSTLSAAIVSNGTSGANTYENGHLGFTVAAGLYTTVVQTTGQPVTTHVFGYET